MNIASVPTHPQRRLKRASDLSMKHVEIPKHMQEDPFREFKIVQDVLSETQAEVDERKSVSKQWWMPYHIGRETWHSYDVSKLLSSISLHFRAPSQVFLSPIFHACAIY